MKSFVLSILGIALCVFLSGFDLPAEERELEVERAKLGRGIEEREIVDEDSIFTSNERVYLWMKVTGGTSDSIAVAWKIEDYHYTYKLHIGGNPWRTWAYKTVWKAGDWTVTVTDSKGKILKERTFKVEAKKE